MKKIYAIIISFTMLFAGLPACASAETFQGDKITGASSEAASYGYTDPQTGDFIYSDPEVTVPESASKGAAKAAPEDESLPAHFDLRDEGRSTSIKDQGDRNVCWAFSACASMESNLITKGLVGSGVDLSEAHLGYFLINGQSSAALSRYAGDDQCFSTSEATNFYAAAATLARGFGAVNENDMPYSAFAGGHPDPRYTNEEAMTRCRWQLQDAIYINAWTTTEKYDEAAFNAVKKLIMENGAVASRIHFPDSYELQATFGSKKPNELKTYYSTDEAPNHAVTIIGWDDDFDDFKSAEKPAGPGAWIVKDSYGEDLHGDGYFYLSYYSPSPGQFVSFTADKASGRQIYQYDGVGVGDGMIRLAGKVTGSNTYTARSDVLLDQMMTFAPEAGCTINVKIYVTKNDAKPVSGVKVYDKSFTKEYTGYSRTDLGQTVGIPKGAKFSVLVTTKTSSGNYFVPFELENINDPLNKPALVKSGQSDVYTGGAWKKVGKATKMKDAYGDTCRLHNALIKVFGKSSGTAAQTISVKTTRQVKKGKTIKLAAKRTKGAGKLVYQTSNSSRASVTSAGVVKAKTKGKVKITVFAQPTAKYKSAKKVVTVTVK